MLDPPTYRALVLDTCAPPVFIAAMTAPSKKITVELEKLRDEINRHNRLYFVEDKPEISDAEFDRLFDRLLAIERMHPELVTTDSPSQRIGAAPSQKFESVEHRLPMLSLQKVTSPAPLAPTDPGFHHRSRKLAFRQAEGLLR